MTKRRSFKTLLLILQGIFLTLLLSSFISGSSVRRAITVSPKDSITSATYIKNSINYARIYDFINYNLNYIQWNNKEAILPFYDKLKQTPNRKLKILHIGDSHVQADYFTGYVREEMQRIFGTGGRGFVFPYAAAETHSAYDYRTYCSGNWQYSRNIQPYPVYDIGISGATIHTTDSTATFSFVFKSFALKDEYKLIKLYCKQSPESYDIRLLASGEPDTILISCSQQSHLPYVPVLLKSSSDTLEFFITKTKAQQNYFDCYGLLIETTEDNGVLYSSVGINGAGYKSILKESLFPSQLLEYKPDLVIIDLGANDFFGYTLNEYELEYNLKAIIDMIRKAAPSASIIISNAQDIFKRKRNIAECQPFSVLTRKIAFANNCGFFDYFNVSGGKLSMLKWSKNNLAQRDRVHLSGAGYYVRGELFLNALLNSYYQLLVKDTLEHFVLDYGKIDSLNVILTENINKNKPLYYQNDLNYKPKNPKINTKTDYYYSIRPGDNLGKIAEEFGVTINDLKDWNGISGTKIIAGEVLLIHPKKSVPKTTNPTDKKNLSNTNSSGNKTYYTVQSGDNLWTISQKFGVSVENIQNWSNLSGDGVKPGDILVVYVKPSTKTTVKTTDPKNNNSHSATKHKVTHTVISGDTLWAIAKKYNVTVESIMKLNNLKDDKLKLGTILIIK